MVTLDIEIQEEDVESKPENIPDAARIEDVDITSIRRYFTRDAWLLVEDAKQKLRAVHGVAMHVRVL